MYVFVCLIVCAALSNTYFDSVTVSSTMPTFDSVCLCVKYVDNSTLSADSKTIQSKHNAGFDLSLLSLVKSMLTR